MNCYVWVKANMLKLISHNFLFNSNNHLYYHQERGSKWYLKQIDLKPLKNTNHDT